MKLWEWLRRVVGWGGSGRSPGPPDSLQDEARQLQRQLLAHLTQLRRDRDELPTRWALHRDCAFEISALEEFLAVGLLQQVVVLSQATLPWQLELVSSTLARARTLRERADGIVSLCRSALSCQVEYAHVESVYAEESPDGWRSFSMASAVVQRLEAADSDDDVHATQKAIRALEVLCSKHRQSLVDREQGLTNALANLGSIEAEGTLLSNLEERVNLLSDAVASASREVLRRSAETCDRASRQHLEYLGALVPPAWDGRQSLTATFRQRVEQFRALRNNDPEAG